MILMPAKATFWQRFYVLLLTGIISDTDFCQFVPQGLCLVLTVWFFP